MALIRPFRRPKLRFVSGLRVDRWFRLAGLGYMSSGILVGHAKVQLKPAVQPCGALLV